MRPTFWLLDEPTASLDTEAVLRFGDLVKHILDEGAGVLLTAHQSGSLLSMCHESWVLKEGRLHGQSS
ncbi:ABC transporter ATP-binding protein [Nitrincola nitratireducens]|uniref:Lipopolysaccharide export system ATP-binding protein LptB n=1 Tax=Nitrincola nitratireducens TaxID=1229521 RepID=W9V178_9GAMM|nr:ABC transporter ATP-binding protein [Nitrincola nitratireducens]EXJ09867.1 Lipopolysaccharide export system ATP-binding protein LptB [Nitrincola nitratireducens]